MFYDPEQPDVDTPPRRFIGYVRVSTSQQADSGLGLEAQETALRAWATSMGYEYVRTEVDAGKSAATMNRAALQRALKSVRSHHTDGLVVLKLDRLSRSVKDFSEIVDDARENDWQLVVVRDGLDTESASGRLFANILASFAQFERELISQRTKEALAAKKARGEVVGSAPIYTFTREQTSKMLRMKKRGYTERELASVFKVSRKVIRRVLKEQDYYAIDRAGGEAAASGEVSAHQSRA